jgi:hypothetical protein
MRLELASLEAIKYACLNFHYAKAVPVSAVGLAVFNDKNEWCGCITYGRGANNHLAQSFNMSQGEVVELTRMALNGKQESTSKALALSLKIIRKYIPTAKLIVSYADFTNQNHIGTIYKATNWLYLGKRTSKGASYYIINGKKMHGRSVRAKWGSEKNIQGTWTYAEEQTKLLYAYPLIKGIQLKSIDYIKKDAVLV